MRRILHLDMDAFYASVEQHDNPDLRGRPVAVGGDPHKRGVVAAASYEARAFGVRSANPMAKAIRLCPSLVIVRPDFTKYRGVSQQVFEIFRRVTRLVRLWSVGWSIGALLGGAQHRPRSVTLVLSVGERAFLAELPVETWHCQAVAAAAKRPICRSGCSSPPQPYQPRQQQHQLEPDPTCWDGPDVVAAFEGRAV